MPDSFGARLRERREQQQVALSTIAEQTKIKISLLEALERDDVSHWPSGIFRRAFIRAYAHAIGLEPDVIVRESLELYPDPIEIVDTLQTAASNGEGAWVSDAPPTRLRHLVASAIGSVSRLRPRATQRSGSLFDGSIAPPTPIDSIPASAPPPPSSAASASRDDEVPDLLAAEPSAIVPVPSESPAPPIAYVPEIEPAGVAAPVASVAVALEPPPPVQDRSEPDLLLVADLCTELGRAETAEDVQLVLQETARILGAVGLIVWVWDPIASELRPALAQGYSERVLAQLPRVERETNNATAAAFRAAQTCVVKSSDAGSGALAVPLLTPGGCAGVLAIELTDRKEDRGSVRALAMIVAAQLAALIGGARPAEATGRLFA
jgi:transcriptional regulator with XRE-family HTH domain